MGLWCGNNGPDCTLYQQGRPCGKYQADSDIAGIGVIIAFVSTSLVNLFIAFIGHTFSILRGYENNAIDARIFRVLQKVWLLRINQERKVFWRPVIERLILLLSDYQLLFGVAILIAGFWKHCSISVYHFSLVVDLAWFSNTHMTSLSVLKIYLQERKTLRNWRVCIMIMMLAMMLVAIILASNTHWNASTPCPAQCLFNEPAKNFAHTNPYFFALVLHYTTSIWRVFDTSAVDKYLLGRPREVLRQIARRSKRQDSNLSKRSIIRRESVSELHHWLFACLIRVYLGLAALLGSMTISLYYDMLWFSLGLAGILLGRDIPSSDMNGDENRLNFGQIVPMLMLASIVLTFKEVYTEQKLKSYRTDPERGEIVETFSSNTCRSVPPAHDAERPRQAAEPNHEDVIVSLRIPNEKYDDVVH